MPSLSDSHSQKGFSFYLRDGSAITGTLVWYVAVCEREVWLMSRNLTPDSEDQALDIGRAIHETTYQSEKKEIQLEGIKLDLVKDREKLVCEVKTSSKYIEAAKLQLLYYLYRLKVEGYEYEGQILVPKEKKIYDVKLDKENEDRLKQSLTKIKDIVSLESPPPPKFIPFCRRCAYRYFCWTE